ncbi:hypothetical protein [Catenuloplanes indicus]|uniref:Uncharacterized protein n=1 Tax=Catenuloplanes indicus TaxID=137267 RepID=A0AAE3VT83_9ACTN|nr:hypothetical protein [Catenuloplanes indicus]MDQ0363411.1 hypothetical protein [Catenuloplanes indicus]
MTPELLAEAINSLERVGCQFWACEGPTLDPIDMVTCYRCTTLGKLYAVRDGNLNPTTALEAAG